MCTTQFAIAATNHSVDEMR